jgi:hypothetical protein
MNAVPKAKISARQEPGAHHDRHDCRHRRGARQLRERHGGQRDPEQRRERNQRCGARGADAHLAHVEEEPAQDEVDDPREREERHRLAARVAQLAQVLGEQARHHQDRGGHEELEERRDPRVLDAPDGAPVDALEEPEPDARGSGPQNAAHVRATVPPK